MKIKKYRSFLPGLLPTLILIAASAPLSYGQSSHLLYGEGGSGFSLLPSWDSDGEWTGIDASLGRSLAAVMDIGLTLSYDPVDEEDFSGIRFTTAADLRAYLLKQGLSAPFSLFIEGSYGLVNTISDDLNDRDLHQYGSRLSGGGGVESIIPVFRRFAVHLGGAVFFRRYRMITDLDEDAPDDSAYPMTVYDDTLGYRGFGGMHIFLGHRVLLALEAVAEWDDGFSFLAAGPRLSLLFLPY